MQDSGVGLLSSLIVLWHLSLWCIVTDSGFAHLEMSQSMHGHMMQIRRCLDYDITSMSTYLGFLMGQTCCLLQAHPCHRQFKWSD
jgi:hypothetical protein